MIKTELRMNKQQKYDAAKKGVVYNRNKNQVYYYQIKGES